MLRAVKAKSQDGRHVGKSLTWQTILFKSSIYECDTFMGTVNTIMMVKRKQKSYKVIKDDLTVNHRNVRAAESTRDALYYYN